MDESEVQLDNKPMDKQMSSRSEDEIVRSMIEKENEITNYRVTWLMTVQGLLFASLGFAWDKANIKGFIAVLCMLGILVSIVALGSITWSIAAVIRLYD